MEYQDDLSREICLTTMKIQEEFPELIKYMNEIPRKFQANNKKEVAKKALENYLDSLKNLLKTYKNRHLKK